MYVVGIDPGKTGAIAVLSDNTVIELFDLSGDYKNNTDYLIQAITSCTEDPLVILEKVHAHPKEGVSSVWTFAEGYGVLLGVLTALGIEYEQVHPAVWKRALDLIGKDKNASRAKAKELFPALEDKLKRTTDHGRSDAVLIAKWRLDKKEEKSG